MNMFQWAVALLLRTLAAFADRAVLQIAGEKMRLGSCPAGEQPGN